MCVTAVTFPGQIHCRAIIYCSVKCDTWSWGPLRSTLLISQEEDKHAHGILTTLTSLHSTFPKKA